MDILKDIPKLFVGDMNYNIEIKVNKMGLTVYLDWDPDANCEEKIVIPIRYEMLEDCIHIPVNELVERFEIRDIGLDYVDIQYVHKIMDYMDKHREEIIDMCNQYDWQYRDKKSKDESTKIDLDKLMRYEHCCQEDMSSLRNLASDYDNAAIQEHSNDMQMYG